MMELTHTHIEFFLTYAGFLITNIPRRVVTTALIGVVSLLIGSVLLFYEVRALLTEHQSPIPDPNEPDAYGTIRRIYAWIGGIVCTLAGIGLLYLTISSIHRRIIVGYLGMPY